MTPSDDRSQEPWTDPQTHLDTDPVNAEEDQADKNQAEEAEREEDES